MSHTNNNARRVSCGLDFPMVADLKSSLDNAAASCFDYICVPLSHPRFKREFISGPSKDRNAPFSRSDLVLSSEEWNNSVVGKASQYMDCDSVDPLVRKQSEHTLLQELHYASHLGISVILIPINKQNNTNLARIMNSKFTTYGLSCPVWIQVPMVCPSVPAAQYRNNSLRQTDEIDPWKWWNSFRCLCNHDKKLVVALEVPVDLPSTEVITRWLGEPVKCLIISTNVFLTNKKGYPVLSKAHQDVLRAFAAINVQVILTGTLRHESIKHYVQYIDHLWQTLSTVDPMMAYAQGYEDYLQVPLQPLSDNLDSCTYEVFEKDPVKYSEYQRAIYHALLDRVPEGEKDQVTQVVMVVGAGRGPLVNAALNAAKRADRKVRVYAIEKNPNAVVTLQSHKEELWHDSVTIISSDMRQWKAPEQADILVSELLGSFGDNELSPECLDGAQSFLKDGGISIPCSYTSYLCPVHVPKLYGEISSRWKDPTKPPDTSSFEMPWVVHQQNRFPLADTQPLFTFHHPNKDKVIDNSRYSVLTFKVKIDSMLHGFTGYFETVLYKDVMLSIEPSTYSQGMVSWFPIFFPIKEPIVLKKDDDIVVHFWRLNNKRDVWYEWTVSSPKPIAIHNPNGRSYNIGLLA